MIYSFDNEFNTVLEHDVSNIIRFIIFLIDTEFRNTITDYDHWWRFRPHPFFSVSIYSRYVRNIIDPSRKRINWIFCVHEADITFVDVKRDVFEINSVRNEYGNVYLERFFDISMIIMSICRSSRIYFDFNNVRNRCLSNLFHHWNYFYFLTEISKSEIFVRLIFYHSTWKFQRRLVMR